MIIIDGMIFFNVFLRIILFRIYSVYSYFVKVKFSIDKHNLCNGKVFGKCRELFLNILTSDRSGTFLFEWVQSAE